MSLLAAGLPSTLGEGAAPSPVVPVNVRSYVVKSITLSLEHLIYVHFIYVYLMDHSLFAMILRAICQLPQSQMMVAKSLRITLYYIFIANIFFVIKHFHVASHPPLIIDFIGQGAPSSRLFLMSMDVFIALLQLARVFIIHSQVLFATDHQRRNTPKPTRPTAAALAPLPEDSDSDEQAAPYPSASASALASTSHRLPSAPYSPASTSYPPASTSSQHRSGISSASLRDIERQPLLENATTSSPSSPSSPSSLSSSSPGALPPLGSSGQQPFNVSAASSGWRTAELRPADPATPTMSRRYTAGARDANGEPVRASALLSQATPISSLAYGSSDVISQHLQAFMPSARAQFLESGSELEEGLDLYEGPRDEAEAAPDGGPADVPLDYFARVILVDVDVQRSWAVIRHGYHHPNGTQSPLRFRTPRAWTNSRGLPV
ncbi:uncharacterized protein BJ171DRAFT_511378 [Polychytrium aggregatum]|uniref:uncharacterized protein n=1 Tax=Polychytrium aggregatum TaxID=110093 RepID=UPI0022FEA9EC|nr:uncharacterized protein BJ171DRAFT_511378 [Polychytrium aggregatum]KAI9202962.1 hypothetical protein BJ171DRAFT_511378 [Polychytrium aggregatum]